MVADHSTAAAISIRPARSLPVGKLLAAFFILYVSFAMVAPANGQSIDSAQVELSARAGFDGYYKGDYWVPIQIQVSNDGPDIQGHLRTEVGSGAGDELVVYRNPISLPSQSKKGQMLYVYVPPFATALTVELVDEAGRVIESTQTNNLSLLASDTILYGAVTEQPGRLGNLENVTGGRSEAAVAYMAPTQLPEVAAAWNALDVIVFHGLDSGRLTAAQRQALDSWLEVGGQLVISGGPAWQETTAGLTDLLPVDIEGTQSLEDIPALRQLSGLPFRDPGPYLVTNSGLREGELLLHHDGLPLLARSEHGRGSVFFLALDPSLAPLLDWDGSQELWSQIADFAQPFPYWATGVHDSYAAARAASSLPTVTLPPAWALLAFLLIYVVVVGPINYLVLRRMNRRELAWITIPGLVILFSATAYLVGFQLKGNDTIVNQMSVLFGQAGGDYVRAQSLIGVYSPRRAVYDLIVPPEAIIRPFKQGYGSLVGQGNVEAVERSADVAVRGIRVDVGGVETLVADIYQPGLDLTGAVRLRSEGSDVVMDINVLNNGDASLENASILFGSSAIALGDIQPGGKIERSERLTGLQASSGVSGSGGAYAPSPAAVSPLSANMATILGSADYYSDGEVYPRWQLLQALAPQFGVGSGNYPLDTATLIAWSDQEQMNLGLRDADFSTSATSLYFLEMPVSQEIAGTGETIIPRSLLGWQVLAESGIYGASIDGLYLTPGWVEFEFVPYADLQAMSVQNLGVVLKAGVGAANHNLPLVQLWDWSEETWRTPGDTTWGRITIEDPLTYVGPRNAVRIRLQNNGPDGIDIQEVYPELSGTFE